MKTYDIVCVPQEFLSVYKNWNEAPILGWMSLGNILWVSQLFGTFLCGFIRIPMSS